MCPVSHSSPTICLRDTLTRLISAESNLAFSFAHLHELAYTRAHFERLARIKDFTRIYSMVTLHVVTLVLLVTPALRLSKEHASFSPGLQLTVLVVHALMVQKLALLVLRRVREVAKIWWLGLVALMIAQTGVAWLWEKGVRWIDVKSLWALSAVLGVLLYKTVVWWDPQAMDIVEYEDDDVYDDEYDDFEVDMMLLVDEK